MSSKKLLLAGVSALTLCLGLAMPEQAAADTTVSSNTSSSVAWTTGNLTIDSGVTVSATPAVSATGISGGTLTNSGSISGSGGSGVYNTSGSSIGTLTNSGSISGGNSGISNSGSIGTLTNSGSISGNSGIGNYGSIGALTNSGTISGVAYAIYSSGSIGTLTNNGTISSSYSGVYNSGSGSIGTLTNNGAISGRRGVHNNGSIDTLTNNGTISGSSRAIYSSGSIGLLTNSGVIAGNINNSSANALTINGSTVSSSPGLLTGYNSGSASLATIGAKGAISNTSANLVFGSGYLLLNDDVDVTGRHLNVTGATVSIVNHIAVTGDYNQTGGGLVVVTSSNGTSYGSISATTATVSGTAITISGSGLTSGETFTVVHAGGAHSYANDTYSVSGTSGLIATGAASGNDLIVTLASPGNYTSTGRSAGGNAASLGGTLDAIKNGTSSTAVAFQNAVLTPLGNLPTSAQGTAMKQLAPSQAPSQMASTLAVAPVTSAVEQHQQTALLSPGNGDTGAAAGSEGREFKLWGQFLGGGAQRDTTADADGYRSRSAGLVAGLDWLPTADTSAGVALSYVKGWSWGADNSSGSLTKLDNVALTTYGAQRFGNAFINGQLGVGYNHFDQTRSINFLGQHAYANYGGEQYLAKAGGGYDFDVDNGFTVTPLASWSYLRSVSDQYSETGSSANLNVDRRGVQSLSQSLGAKATTKLNTVWGAVTPELGLAWVHDYTKGPIASSGLMGGSTFASTTARPSADGARVNAAATLESAGDISLRLEYEGEIRHDYQSHTGLVKASWDF